MTKGISRGDAKVQKEVVYDKNHIGARSWFFVICHLSFVIAL